MNRYKFLRQAITLSGLGSATFQNALMAANEIYGHFDRQFSEGTLDSWNSSPVDDNDFHCINLSNRFFTPANEADGLEAIPFHKGVDPRGILQNMAKGDGLTTHVHTEDNQVQYFSTKKDTEGSIKSVKNIYILIKMITTDMVLNNEHPDMLLANPRCSALATSCKPKSLSL